MKRLKLFVAGLALAFIAACASAPPGGPPLTSAQQAVASTTLSYNALDAAILAADSAVKAGTLKGQDARNTLKGLTDAKLGLDLALATLRTANAAAAAASAASGVKP